jgi:hypothetical protein
MTVFDWNGYLDLALELQLRSDEASLRTAISRAYYFVFNAAQNRTAVVQYQIDPKLPVHEELWGLYERNDGECKRLATIAKRLKFKRVKADYQKFSYFRVGDELRGVIADAKDCAAILSKLDSDLPKPLPKIYRFGR